jgi:hypothetical protein
MKTYHIEFTGRNVGAIGAVYRITEEIQAENETDAGLKLYDKYELISNIIIFET